MIIACTLAVIMSCHGSLKMSSSSDVGNAKMYIVDKMAGAHFSCMSHSGTKHPTGVFVDWSGNVRDSG